MKTLFFIVFILVSNVVFSQDIEEIKPENPKKIKKAKRDSIRKAKLSQGKIMLTPYLAPGYTPELSGILSVGALLSFKTNKKDTLIQRSSIPLAFSYTISGAVIFASQLTTYWFKDKFRLNGDFKFKNMPDHYWGIGYNSAYNNYKSDSTTYYNRKWWIINPQFFYHVKYNLLIGLDLDFNYTKGSEEAYVASNDSLYQLYNNKPYNAGLGFIFRYDTRDIPVNAYSGMLIEFKTTFYSTKLGGDNDYKIFQFDYRQYQTIINAGHVFAWQLKGRFGTGNIPYGEMSQIGTPWDLRGYLWGRYRNKDMIFFIGEYRHTFRKKTGELSKHGFVTWIAGGKVFSTLTVIDNTNKWLPNAGIGYRLEIQPRMNIRIDFGIGRKSNGIYFNFNEAF